MNTKEKIIKIEQLTKSFGGKIILSTVDLNLLKGENLAILGKSGVGKSVLLKCIVRLLFPDSGNITVFDEPVLDLEEDELMKLRQRIGYLFQSGALYDSMSVKDNLMFPMKRSYKSFSDQEQEELIVEALESVGLLDAIDKMPAELSGGMRKRAGLARTLVMRPEIILYDEPTTGLDPFTSEEISELIVEIQKKYQASSIIVTHDMKSAKIISNRMLILSGGIFIAEGDYNTLKNHEKVEVKGYFK